MTFASLLTTPVRRALSVLDWVASIVICYVCILTLAIFTDGLSSEVFGKALFMMLLGLMGPVIGLLGSYDTPMLIPLFVVLSAMWGGMFYALMRVALRRFIQVSILTAFWATFLTYGVVAVSSTMAI